MAIRRSADMDAAENISFLAGQVEELEAQRDEAMCEMAKSHEEITQLEAALTAAYEQGWDEGVEAALTCDTQHHPDSVSHLRDQIRRLRIGQGV